jgi:hypothetical protein
MNGRKKKINTSDLIKKEKTKDYNAKIYQNENNNKSNLINNLNQNNNNKIVISNIQIGDKDGNFKEIFKFNEKIYVFLDYELPEDKIFYFNVDIEIEEENRKVDLNPYIKRTKSGNIDDSPISFMILGDDESENINITNLKIIVYEAGNYELPIYDINQPVNIIVEGENEDILKNKINNNLILVNNNSKQIENIDEKIICLELINDLFKEMKTKPFEVVDSLEDNLEELKKCSKKNYQDADFLLNYYNENI